MVCDEPFEQFWKEEEESWHFRDAMRDPSGKVYCYPKPENTFIFLSYSCVTVCARVITNCTV